ncbi:IS110 family transposase [Salmonella enterica]|uniref:IS110 family transposase n=1 Tax=Salmonella enterica TaxID=28901 RepID=A0A5U7RSP7_SALER|nr:IS110 family transposase [Salmonella enterica]EHW6438490.1 IS110 family transposase [Salmonella enterica]
MFYVGIDVSKCTLDICLLRDGVRGKVKTRKFKNDGDAAAGVVSWLDKQHCPPEDTHVIMEATGVYHELTYGLHHAGVRVSLANPHRSREFAHGMGILTKNDRVDAYMLACYGALKAPDAWIPPPEAVRLLRALLRRRDTLVADRGRERNRLEKCRHGFTEGAEAVRASVEAMLRHLDAEIRRLDGQIMAHVQGCPSLKNDLALLTSIKSVGVQTGLHMLVILRSHQFSRPGQAAAFLGVVPVEKTSGTSVRGRARMSKIGPPEIRAVLYMAAMCGSRFNPAMKRIFENLLLQGKARMCAIGALMRRLVHWCWGVLHSQRPFDPEYQRSWHEIRDAEARLCTEGA